MGPLEFRKVDYAQDLNAKQKENYNYQKISGVLADYGYTTIRLTDDWQGADFIAQHYKSKEFIKVQLKGRLTFKKDYLEKGMYICFRNVVDNNDIWYLIPHDDFFREVVKSNKKLIKGSISWDVKGGYSFPGLSKINRRIIEKYRIPQIGPAANV